MEYSRILTFFATFTFCSSLYPMQQSSIQSILKQESKIGGNKYANLCVLRDKIVPDTQLQAQVAKFGLSVKIPEFRIISDLEGKALINQQGFALEHEWQRHCSSFSEKEAFLKQADSFSQSIKNLIPTEKILPSLLSRSIKQFLQSAPVSGIDQLIIRSTSEEDGDTSSQAISGSSNAGGNESIPCVKADPKEVILAANKVIASSFSCKSLSQRSEYESLENLNLLPRTPVLIQHMVGETDPNRQEPSIGCVIYTQEPYANTDGITVIQAVLGHNKGLVDGDVEADTYFVGKDGSVFSVIRNKQKRIIPSQQGAFDGLDFADNPVELIKQPVLRQQEIKALKLVADAIHKLYSKVMDIELILDRQKNTIFLVQARPLEGTSQFNPSYMEQFNASDSITGSTALPGDCQVKHITTENQILVAPTLDSALNIYNNPSFDKKQLEVIIVQEHAEPTSHAAAILRHAGKIVMVIPQPSVIESLLKNKTFSLFCDPQRGIIVNTPAAVVKAGWFKHPIPQRLSVMSTERQATLPQFTNHFQGVQLVNLISMLKDPSMPGVDLVLESILSSIQQKQSTLSADLSDDFLKRSAYTATRKLGAILDCAFTLSRHIKEVGALPACDIKRLYYINYLGALTEQRKFPGDVNAYSVNSVCECYEQEKQFIEKIRPLIERQGIDRKIITEYSTFKKLIHGHTVAFPEMEMQWIYLVNFAATQWNAAHLLTLVDDLGMLPTFINCYLNAYVSTQGIDFSKQPDKLDAFCQHASHEFGQCQSLIAQLSELHKKLTSYHIEEWAKPENFDKLLAHWNAQFMPFFMSTEVKNTLSDNNRFAVLATLSAMDRFVTIFDSAIKTLKGSTLYQNKTVQAINVKRILESYHALLTAWIEYIPEGTIKCPSYTTPSKFIADVGAALKKCGTTEDMLLGTRGFVVGYATLGNSGALSAERIYTLEDAFTVIHQNLIIINGILCKKVLPMNLMKKPELFSRIEQQLLSSTTSGGSSPFLINLSCRGNELFARYNQILNGHSVLYEINYKKDCPTVTLTLNYVGTELARRWQDIESFSRIMVPIILDIKTKTVRWINDSSDLCIQFIFDKGSPLLATILSSMANRANRYGSEFQELLAHLLEKNPSLVSALMENVHALSINDMATVIKYVSNHQDICCLTSENPLMIQAKKLIHTNYLHTTKQLFEALLAMKPCDRDVQETACSLALGDLNSRYSVNDGCQLTKSLFASQPLPDEIREKFYIFLRDKLLALASGDSNVYCCDYFDFDHMIKTIVTSFVHKDFNQPLCTRLIELAGTILKNIRSTVFATDIFKHIITMAPEYRQDAHQQAMRLVNLACNSGDTNHMYGGIRLLQELVNLNLRPAVQAAPLLAYNAAINSDRHVCQAGLNLFEALFEKLDIKTAALEWARKAVIEMSKTSCQQSKLQEMIDEASQ